MRVGKLELNGISPPPWGYENGNNYKIGIIQRLFALGDSWVGKHIRLDRSGWNTMTKAEYEICWDSWCSSSRHNLGKYVEYVSYIARIYSWRLLSGRLLLKRTLHQHFLRLQIHIYVHANLPEFFSDLHSKWIIEVSFCSEERSLCKWIFSIVVI